jgi:hypothetical protein
MSIYMPDLVVSQGLRHTESARELVCDLAGRFVRRVRVTSDRHRPCLKAVETGFGADANSFIVGTRNPSEAAKIAEIFKPRLYPPRSA